MTVVIGILALIGLAVVGAVGWAFVQGVRDGLAAWREASPGGTSEPLPVGEPPLSLSAALPSSYQAGQLAGEVAASWHSAHQAARTGSAAGVPASSSWAAALALGSELSQQRQEAGRASSGGSVTDESSGNSGEPAAGTARPTWPAHSPSRRPPRPRPRRCTQQRPARADERQS